MKRLIDETRDDLTRALLEAGVEHRPPRGNRARLIAALGAASVTGLISSKAFGWLGTGAGKASLAGVSLAVAGALYGAVSRDAPAGDESPAPVQPLEARIAPAPNSSLPVLEAAVSQSGKDKAVPTRSFELLPLPAPPPPPRAEPRSAEGVRTSSSSRSGAEPAKLPLPDPGLGLDIEVKWVDQMRAAVQRGDGAELESLLERYQAAFPNGQLRQEVADLAARR